MKLLSYILFFNALYIASFAQDQKLQWQSNNLDLKIIQESVKSNLIFSNEVALNIFLQETLNKMRANGFLAISIDSIAINNNIHICYVSLGKKYQWAKLNISSIPEIMLNNIGYQQKQFNNAIIQQKQIASICEKLLQYCDNNGYPFAQVYLDSFKEEKDLLNAKLIFKKNNFIHIDSIDIQGDVAISDVFIYKYLNVKPGDVYNESIIKKLSTRIRELSFLQEEKPWRMSFSVSKNILTLYLAKKDANKADILVGILPSNNALGGKFLLTGDVKLALVNSLNLGESITLNWQNLQYKSPRLILEALYPYMLGTALGVSGKFNYTKNDSSFRNVAGELGLHYAASAYQSFKTYWNTNTANTITVDTFFIKTYNKLPINSDLKIQTFGLEWHNNKTDYKLNPRKGFSWMLNGSLGIKNIQKNNTIENLYNSSRGETYKYLYDSIALKSYRYTLLGNIAIYTAITKRITTKWSYSGAIIYNKNIFKNELFQIGGYRMLRGFDEASLFVNQYQVATIEPRYLLTRNSYLFMFNDLGLVSSPFFEDTKNKIGIGIGAGISLETKNGMFNFIYALGNNLGSGIEFKNSKIHFGYVNAF